MSVKIISDLKSKAISFEQKHKVVPKAVAAATAITCMGVPVSAADGTTSGVDYSSIADALKASFARIAIAIFIRVKSLVPFSGGA